MSAIGSGGAKELPQSPLLADLSNLKEGTGKIKVLQADGKGICQLAAKTITSSTGSQASSTVHIKLIDQNNQEIVRVAVKIKDLLKLGLSKKQVIHASQQGTLSQLIQQKLQSSNEIVDVDEKKIVQLLSDFTSKSHLSLAQRLGDLSELFYTLYQTKETALSKKENASETKNVAAVADKVLCQAFSILYPDTTEEKITETVAVFEKMLEVILADAYEEVVGQERQPGAIASIIKNQLKVSNPDAYADLYPVALLSAYHDESVSIPTENVKHHLTKDITQFKEEFKSQFPNANRTNWNAMFGDCLAEVWKKQTK